MTDFQARRKRSLDEFWVCQHCRSLNRAGTGRCYHCRQKLGSKPKEAETLVRGGPLPAPAAYPPGAIGSSGPVALGGPIGGSIGGPKGGPSDDDLPAYLSRPVALAPTPVRDFSAPAAQVRPARQFRRPSLTGWIRRRIAWSLATRPFVQIRFVGYLAAVLLTMVLLTGALIVTTVIPLARVGLQTGSFSAAWAQVGPGGGRTLESMAIAFAILGVLALLFFSILVGLSTHNAQGLGVETPRLTPYNAGTCWLALLWAQARIAVGLLVPACLFWLGYPLPGLIAALIAVEVAQRNLDDPFGWLTNPSSHLPDLFAKFGLSASNRSLLGTAWSICFRAANALAIVVYAMPILAFAISTIASISGRTDILVWPSSGTGPYQLAIAAVVALLILTTSVAIGLLVPISFELVERQRTRKTLVRVGRSRSWVSPPGYGSAPAPDSGSARYDPYEQNYEREPDQASLYSPSTTSSFPWEADSSEEAPPD